MLNWQTDFLKEREIQNLCNSIFHRYPKLIAFVFDPYKPKLRMMPKEILNEMAGFSPSEKVFGRVLLDLWDGSGLALFQDVVRSFEPQIVKAFISISKL